MLFLPQRRLQQRVRVSLSPRKTNGNNPIHSLSVLLFVMHLLDRKYKRPIQGFNIKTSEIDIWVWMIQVSKHKSSSNGLYENEKSDDLLFSLSCEEDVKQESRRTHEATSTSSMCYVDWSHRRHSLLYWLLTNNRIETSRHYSWVGVTANLLTETDIRGLFSPTVFQFSVYSNVSFRSFLCLWRDQRSEVDSKGQLRVCHLHDARGCRKVCYIFEPCHFSGSFSVNNKHMNRAVDCLWNGKLVVKGQQLRVSWAKPQPVNRPSTTTTSSESSSSSTPYPSMDPNMMGSRPEGLGEDSAKQEA